MIWLIPVVIGGVAIGAAAVSALLSDDTKPSTQKPSTQKPAAQKSASPAKSAAKPSGSSASVQAEVMRRRADQRSARLQNYRRERNRQVEQFRQTHRLKLKGAERALQIDNPDDILAVVKRAVDKRIAYLNRPANELEGEIDELSAIRAQLVSLLE